MKIYSVGSYGVGKGGRFSACMFFACAENEEGNIFAEKESIKKKEKYKKCPTSS